jgi:hypothetical protein
MKEFESNINRTYEEYHSKSIRVVDYWALSLYSSIIIDNLNPQIINSILSRINDTQLNYAHFEKTRNRLNLQSKAHGEINIELVYKSSFQFFEEYLAELISHCFRSFPYYMNLFEAKNEIPFEKIYNDSDNIQEIKDYMITYRVKKLIQSNNIIDAISRVEKTFNFQFNIEKEILDGLFVTCANRNILTHNSGIVNDIYISQLKSRKISTNLKKGDSVFSIIKTDYFLNEMYFQSTTAKKIYDTIIKDTNRLRLHHESLKKNFS